MIDLQIWKKLATLPQDTLTERDLQLQSFPFRTLDNPCEPHPGLRAYPFLGQVGRIHFHLHEVLNWTLSQVSLRATAFPGTV